LANFFLSIRQKYLIFLIHVWFKKEKIDPVVFARHNDRLMNVATRENTKIWNLLTQRAKHHKIAARGPVYRKQRMVGTIRLGSMVIDCLKNARRVRRIPERFVRNGGIACVRIDDPRKGQVDRRRAPPDGLVGDVVERMCKMRLLML